MYIWRIFRKSFNLFFVIFYEITVVFAVSFEYLTEWIYSKTGQFDQIRQTWVYGKVLKIILTEKILWVQIVFLKVFFTINKHRFEYLFSPFIRVGINIIPHEKVLKRHKLILLVMRRQKLFLDLMRVDRCFKGAI